MRCSLSGKCIEPYQLTDPDTGYAWINEYFKRFESIQASMSVSTETIVDDFSGELHWVLRIQIDFKVGFDTVAVEDYPVFTKSTQDLDLELIKVDIETALASAYTSLSMTRKREKQELEDCKNRPHCDPEALKDTGGHPMRVEGRNFKFK